MVITIEKLVRLDANYMHAFLGKKDGPKETKTPRVPISKKRWEMKFVLFKHCQILRENIIVSMKRLLSIEIR